MTTVSEFNRYGETLERLLLLQTSPVAVKMIEKEEDIPQGAIRPKKDHGYHLAQCQAFAMSRREKATIAMLKEDNWCPAPLMVYGLAPKPDNQAAQEPNDYDCFEYGKYIGILSAPLKTANFKPDVVIIYCDTNQLRRLLLTMKIEERPLVSGDFFPPSCAFSVVPPLLHSQYRVVLPDPGEYGRALTQAGEMMFCVPGVKIGKLTTDLSQIKEIGPEYAQEVHMKMRPDFPQPERYKKMFKEWGIEF